MPSLHVTDDAHWRTLRSRYVGGSEISALFSEHPRLTYYELYHRKLGNIPEPDLDDNERVKAGKFLEPAVAAWTAEKTGWKLQKVRRYIAHDDPAVRLGGSVDYEIIGHDKGPGILEIKVMDYLIFRDLEDGQPPLSYELQLQQYCGLTHRTWGAIAILVGGNDLKIFEREARPKTYGAIEDAAREFWRRVETGQEPKPDFTQDGATIAKLYASATSDKVVDLSGSNRVPELCASYAAASAEEKRAGDAKDAAKAELLHTMGDAAMAVCGRWKISAGTVAGGSVSYERKPYRNFRLTEKRAKEERQNG